MGLSDSFPFARGVRSPTGRRSASELAAYGWDGRLDLSASCFMFRKGLI